MGADPMTTRHTTNDPIAHMVHSLVEQERQRQVDLGYTPEHDLSHDPDYLMRMIQERFNNFLTGNHLTAMDVLKSLIQCAAMFEAVSEAYIRANPHAVQS